MTGDEAPKEDCMNTKVSRFSFKSVAVLSLVTMMILVVSGCQKKEVFSIDLENYPKIDGSTVTIPLSEAVAATLTGKTIEEVKPYILHNKTHDAYVNLINRKADLIFVTAPSEEELKLAADKDVELELIPIVSEGFVFLTHVDNPIETLSQDQIKDIFQGKITNWKDVGGSDTEIIAYQRPVNSGSQTGFLEMVMKGDTPVEAPMEEVVAEMGMLIDAVANFENTSSALGYSYYYFVVDMWGNESVKLLSVDGVYPDASTISTGAYPYTTAYYAVIRKSTPEDSDVRKIISWILSDEGQNLMEESGYVKVQKK